MIYLQVIDTLQEVFGDIVYNQAVPLKDSWVTNTKNFIRVSGGPVTHLDEDGDYQVERVTVINGQRQEPIDNTALVEMAQAIFLILKNMETCNELVTSVHRQVGSPSPHVDTNYATYVSAYDITYRMK